MLFPASFKAFNPPPCYCKVPAVDIMLVLVNATITHKFSYSMQFFKILHSFIFFIVLGVAYDYAEVLFMTYSGIVLLIWLVKKYFPVVI
jgi:hypothetical protein